jgi:hypothetical protein
MSTYENNDPVTASDPRIALSISIWRHRNRICAVLSRVLFFNGLLDLLFSYNCCHLLIVERWAENIHACGGGDFRESGHVGEREVSLHDPLKERLKLSRHHRHLQTNRIFAIRAPCVFLSLGQKHHVDRTSNATLYWCP